MEEKNKIRGKKARASGARFELKTRADLENKGWILDKWNNNVDLKEGKLVKAKRKYNPFKKGMAIGTGFPDFICFTKEKEWKCYVDEYEIRYTNKKLSKDQASFQVVIGVECRSSGYLDKEEKEKADWLLDNNIFSKILIAMKDKNKRGGIIYKEWKSKKK